MIKVHFPIHCSEIPNTLQWDLKYTVMRLALHNSTCQPSRTCRFTGAIVSADTYVCMRHHVLLCIQCPILRGYRSALEASLSKRWP